MLLIQLKGKHQTAIMTNKRKLKPIWNPTYTFTNAIMGLKREQKGYLLHMRKKQDRVSSAFQKVPPSGVRSTSTWQTTSKAPKTAGTQKNTADTYPVYCWHCCFVTSMKFRHACSQNSKTHSNCGESVRGGHASRRSPTSWATDTCKGNRVGTAKSPSFRHPEAQYFSTHTKWMVF